MKKKIIANALVIFLILIFLFSIYKITSFYIELYSNKKINNKLIKDVVKIEKITEDDKEVEKFTVDFDSLLEINKDIRGWIRFNADKINYPIVQSTDNSYYLNHTFDKKKNSIGSIFMDYRNRSLKDKNVVLFGHNSASGTMFGSLKEALKADFFDKKENRIIEIIDVDNNVHHYEIFSIYSITKEEYYITTDFATNEEYMEFLDTIKVRSIKRFESDLSNTDTILTLSTCNGVSGTSRRLVVHAKLIN